MKHTMKRTLSILLVCIMMLGTFSAGTVTSAADTGYQNGDVIEFGSYPQSRVTDEETLAALNAMEPEWHFYRNYAQALRIEANYDPDYEMVQKDFMRYADVTYDGQKYRAVWFSKYRPNYSSQIESTVLDQFNHTYENGYEINTVYWFKWEPIIWIVLDAESGLVFTKKVMDVQAFNPVFYKNPAETVWYRDKTCTAYASEYAQSYVRDWLTNRAHENGFSSEAFTDWQRSQIEYTELDNRNVLDEDKSYAGADTTDQVFLFSSYELNGETDCLKWKDFSEWNYPLEIMRSGVTDYSLCQGLECDRSSGEIEGSWMTRSIRNALSRYGANYAWFRTSGTKFSGRQIHGIGGIRPAMRINPELLRSGNLTQPQTVTAGTCGEDVQWAFDEESGVLSLTGSGAMDSLGAFADYGYSVWKDDIQFVAAADGVTSIGAHAFEGCPILEEVILGEGMTALGEAAFFDCPRLRNVTTLSKQLTLEGAFPEDCTGWTFVYPRGCVDAYQWASKSGAGHVPFFYDGGILTFNAPIVVRDGYAYSYLPMLVQRFGKARRIYFNCLSFPDVPANNVPEEYVNAEKGYVEMKYVEVSLIRVAPDGSREDVTYDQMIEMLESGDYDAFKLRVSTPSSDGGEKTQEEIIYKKLEEILPIMPRKVLRLVSRAINFIVSIFKK